MEFTVTKLCFIVFSFVFAVANPARRSPDQMSEIFSKLTAIEDILKSEERMISVLNMGIVASSVDRLNKRVDHIVNLLEQGEQTITRGTGRSTAVAPRDVVTNLQGIDARLRSLEENVEKVEQSVEKTDETFQKVEEVDRRTSQMKDDLNQKLRKMMNVITALYEMNKEMKTDMGARSSSSSSSDDNDARSSSSSTSSYATDFILENLEEMERKIREQFSVLGTELRSEMTSLRIVASSAGSRCDSIDTDDEDLQESGIQGRASPRSGRRVSDNSLSEGSATRVEDTLDVLVQSLGNSTREIREEIHQGIQDIDSKLTSITRMSCSEGLETSESVVSARKVPPPQQDVAAKSEVCSKVARNVTSPKSCADLRRGGATCDGIYVIFPQNVRAVRALCDMTTEGGGWTVLMQRGDFSDKMFSFHKNWASYKNGFGDVEGEFWIGNDVIHLLSDQDENILRVNLEAFDGDALNLTYSSFTVADESTNYKLRLGVTVGTPSPASNSLRYHSNHPFSTFDKKNDNFEQNCAATYKGGWWFNGCYFGFLTGEYFRPGEKRENWQGILWYDWKGNASLKGAQMKIRPKNFST